MDPLGLFAKCQSTILDILTLVTSREETVSLRKDYGFLPIFTGPSIGHNLNPRKPKQIPVIPTINTEIWWALKEMLHIKRFEKTKTFQKLKVFCTEQLTDECGNTSEFNTNFEQTKLTSEVENITDTRIETRVQLIRLLFSM